MNQGQGIIIAVGNQKGGVGKTTNTVNLAAALGQGGYRCLIIDADPTAGATRHLGMSDHRFAGTLELLTTDESLSTLTMSVNMPHNVYLVPARPQLAELDLRLSRYADRTRLLERTANEARSRFDFVFIDTAPFAGATTTVASYAVADWILLTAFPHPLSLAGVSEAFKDIADVRKECNPGLEVLGVVFTNVDGRATRLRSQLESMIADVLPGRRFETFISQAVVLPEMSGKGITLFQLPRYAKHPVARQYMRLAAEIEHRVHNRNAFLVGQLPPLERAIIRTPHTPDVPLQTGAAPIASSALE